MEAFGLLGLSWPSFGASRGSPGHVQSHYDAFLIFYAILGSLGKPGTYENRWLFKVFQRFTFFVLGPPRDQFWDALGLMLEPPGPILGHFGVRMAPKVAQEAPKWGVQFRLAIWDAIFGAGAEDARSTVAERRGPVQLFSWRKLESWRRFHTPCIME